MPKKSKRVASRQAQLSGRSKRVRTHGPTGIPATPARRDQQTEEEAGAKDENQAMDAPSQETVTAREVARPAPSATPRSRSRAIQARPIEAYFGSELKRIGLISIAVFGILAVMVGVSISS